MEETMNSPSDASRAAAGQPLNITVSDIAPNVILCVLNGEIDLATAPRMQQKLTEAISIVPAHLVIDVSDVEFLGSAGLRALIELDAAQQAVGHRLAVIVDHNKAVTRPLRITGLDQVLDLHTELETAVRACREHTSTESDEVPPP
jgi:anti-anti-sigma factor